MKHIDDFFREKLGNYTETPPADVWDELDSRLDTLKPPAPNNLYRRLLHVSMVSLILILGVSLVRNMVLNSNRANKDLASNIPTTTNKATQHINTGNTGSINGSGNSAVTNEAPAANAAGNNDGKPGDDKNALNNTGAVATGAAAHVNSNTEAAQHSDNDKTARTKNAAAQNNKKLNNTAFSKTNNGKHANKVTAYSGNKAGKTGPNAEADEAENEYNSSAAGEGAKNKTTATANDKTSSEKPKEEPATAKKPAAENKQTAPKKDDNKKDQKPRFIRFAAGVKLGFETGFSTAAGNKIVVSPYVEYKVSKKLSIMVQPAAKYANLSSKAFSSQSYYKANEDGIVTQDGPSKIKSHTVGPTVYIDSWTTTYTATQSHDSIVKSYNHGGSYTEFEIPLLLKYNLSRKLSVYGGVSAVYSQVTGIKENTTTVKDIQRSATETITTTTAPVTPGVNEMITYNGNPISNYNGPLTASQKAQLRAGYMLGFSYEPGNRLLFDVLTQISPSNPIMKGGYDISTPLSSPYFRLTVGYKLTK